VRRQRELYPSKRRVRKPSDREGGVSIHVQVEKKFQSDGRKVQRNTSDSKRKSRNTFREGEKKLKSKVTQLSFLREYLSRGVLTLTGKNGEKRGDVQKLGGKENHYRIFNNRWGN